NEPVVRKLLSFRAKVEARTDKGQTPLHLAVHSTSLGCVRALVDAGAALDVATNEERLTPLHLACQRECAQIAQLLVSRGAGVHLRTILGRTALHLAAEVGRIDLLRLLLGEGAELGALDEHGWTPRQVAELFGHRDAQEILIREGMAEKQAVMKELPPAPWHCALWTGVTSMRAKRRGEMEAEDEGRLQDEEILEQRRQVRQQLAVADRRAERSIELAAFQEEKVISV
ncbi:ankyrin repeat-containing domain protein, partial [Ochromonadaceae sp. CCMP2298]